MNAWELDHRRLIAAYELQQNPLCAHMVTLDRPSGFEVAELQAFAERCVRLDALDLNPHTAKFEMVAMHFVTREEGELFLRETDLSAAPTDVKHST